MSLASQRVKNSLPQSFAVGDLVSDVAPISAASPQKRRTWAYTEGLPLPLGVTWIEEDQAFNFAVCAEHAESVKLFLYSPTDLAKPVLTFQFDPIRNKSGRIWHCRIPLDRMCDARYYAYSVSGQAVAGLRGFDDEKVLLDPYAKRVFFSAGFDRKRAIAPGPNQEKAPLGVLPELHSAFDWAEDVSPRRESDAIIYELHVKGFTQPSQFRRASIPSRNIHRLDRKDSVSEGPWDHCCRTDAHISARSTRRRLLGLHALELLRASCGVWHHVATMGNILSSRIWSRLFTMPESLSCSTLCTTIPVKAITWAQSIASRVSIPRAITCMSSDPTNPYANHSGTGNTLNFSQPHVRKMVMDSLRYWKNEMHIDGFRFDLASVFSRNADGSLNWGDAPIFSEIAADPELGRLALIAEPWDVGGYQLGRGFPGTTWLQWNARYRDDVRRFVRGDAGMVPDLMRRIYGSDDLFPDSREHAYHAFQTVNYIDCHDGFTLYDLVSYNHKHNWKNGHDNQDGMDANYSWNCGHEGDEGAAREVLALRGKQAKNFFCLLMLSNGIPMFRAGDEFLNTQFGNNNPYNQDNETSWLDWNQLKANQDVFRFFKGMIAFRKSHPSLCRSRFWREDISWYGVGPTVDLSPDSRSLAFCLHGASQDDDDIYVMINAYWQELQFQIQEGSTQDWIRIVDTDLPSPDDFLAHRLPLRRAIYQVAPRSIVVLVRTK